MAETHVFEKGVELLAVKGAPWADKSPVKLRLVLAVLVVQEVEDSGLVLGRETEVSNRIVSVIIVSRGGG